MWGGDDYESRRKAEEERVKKLRQQDKERKARRQEEIKKKEKKKLREQKALEQQEAKEKRQKEANEALEESLKNSEGESAKSQKPTIRLNRGFLGSLSGGSAATSGKSSSEGRPRKKAIAGAIMPGVRNDDDEKGRKRSGGSAPQTGGGNSLRGGGSSPGKSLNRGFKF